MSESVKNTGNGTVVRILGKRKEPGAVVGPSGGGEGLVTVEVEAGGGSGHEGSLAKRTSEAEAFYAEMSRIRAEPSREEGGRKGSAALVEQREEAVRERLAGAEERGECDLATFTCHINSCYRSFQSVRVLAWHMSYSHTDEREALGSPWTCLVCGRVMPSVKGKNSHLATGHRDLCVLHNAQCIQQRVPTTQPLQQRLRLSRGGRVETEPYLLRDELVYDEDSDFEEDVSVPEDALAWDPAHSRHRLQPSRRAQGSASAAAAAAQPPDLAEPVIVVDEDDSQHRP